VTDPLRTIRVPFVQYSAEAARKRLTLTGSQRCCSLNSRTGEKRFINSRLLAPRIDASRTSRPAT
jgi:hypothetical protein